MTYIDLEIIKNFFNNLECKNIFNDLILSKEVTLLKFLSSLELDEVIEITNNLFVNRPLSEELKCKIINLISRMQAPTRSPHRFFF
jgi:hypothetical protein